MMSYDVAVRPQHAEVLITYTCCVLHLINPTHNVLLAEPSCIILSFDNPLFSSDLVVGPLVKTGIKGVFHDHNSVKLQSFMSDDII